MTITDQEFKLLRSINNSEYHSAEPDAEKRAQEPVWVDCIWAFEGRRAFSGVMSSLSKKGLAKTDGECCWLTPKGFAVLQGAVVMNEDEVKA